MEIDHMLVDKLLKDLNLKPIDKIHIGQYVEKIAEVIQEEEDFNDLSMFALLSEEMKQEESTVRKKIERAIKSNKEVIKDNLNTDRPTPKGLLGWILSKVKVRY